MNVRILNYSEVERLLPMQECIDVMDAALRELSSGATILPLRNVVRLPGGQNAFGVMPAYMNNPRSLGAKLVTVFPANHGTSRALHQGAVLLFDADHGGLVALMDGSAITAIRTAAVSAVATRALARGNCRTLALLGSGVQAHTHLEAMRCVHPVANVRVWSRHAQNRNAFAAAARARFDLPVKAFENPADAVRGADIICTVTSSREPVLMGDWLEPGMHVNAVGASLPIAREADSHAVARSSFFVDRRESALHESGDFLMARNDGVMGTDHIMAEIGDVLLGHHPGRTDEDEITMFKSLGLAIEDLASAHHIYTRATAENVGVEVSLGGARSQ